jgi:hypothetical protein
MRRTPRRIRRPLLLAAIMVSVIFLGCDSDQRVVELSRESLNRQAEQNAQMARQSQAVTETTHELIKAESTVQTDANQLQQQLHAERTALNQQRQDLENERRSMADERQRDPIIAETIKGLALVVAAALPLVVCCYLVRSLFLSTSEDFTAAEILIEQLATQGPLLTACANAALPAPADEDRSTSSPPPESPRLGHRSQSVVSGEQSGLRLILVVEGAHDVEFLKRISRILVQVDSSVPDLGQWESDGVLAFVANNGTSTPFPTGFSADYPVEFHLLDRETEPTTTQRETIARALNTRPNCQAVLTSKRALENYLQPDAISEAGGVEVGFGDFDDVAEIVARASFQSDESRGWESLSRRARRRLRDKAKKWLNREAVDRMTPERLAERDPDDEVIGWLQTIAELAGIETRPPA